MKFSTSLSSWMFTDILLSKMVGLYLMVFYSLSISWLHFLLYLCHLENMYIYISGHLSCLFLLREHFYYSGNNPQLSNELEISYLCNLDPTHRFCPAAASFSLSLFFHLSIAHLIKFETCSYILNIFRHSIIKLARSYHILICSLSMP